MKRTTPKAKAPQWEKNYSVTRWTKSMGKPSTQNLKANYNHRRTAYVRR